MMFRNHEPSALPALNPEQTFDGQHPVCRQVPPLRPPS